MRHRRAARGSLSVCYAAIFIDVSEIEPVLLDIVVLTLPEISVLVMVMALLIWMTIVFLEQRSRRINRLLFLLLISLTVIVGTVFGPDAVYLLLN